jgi:hypothetical protein
MADTQLSGRFCLVCGTENARSARFCRQCGKSLTVSPQQRQQGLAFVLNELEALRDGGEMDEDVYLRLRARYLELLAPSGAPAMTPAAPAGLAPAAPPTAPAPTAPGAPRPAVAAKPEGPGWLAEQQANLLLYLGAFLVVIAALVYVGTSGQSGAVKMALLAAYTLAFIVAGVVCLRFERVQQAGVVFFAVGALMVPINFVGAYFFFFHGNNIDPTGLWLAGSLVTALFYGAVSMLGMGPWYPVPMVAASFSSLAAALVLADAPPEAYPGSFIALVLALSAPSALPLGRISETFGAIGSLAAHAVVPIAVIAALSIAGAASREHQGGIELATRWYLPPTVAIAAVFYWTQALWARRAWPNAKQLLTVVALGITGGALVMLVFALDVGHQWYGPAVAIVGWLYAAGSAPFGPRWSGRQHLGWMALAAITVSWLFFEGRYADFPRQGAGVHFAAAAFYLSAARLVRTDIIFGPALLGEQPGEQPARGRVSAAVAFVYAAGLTLGIGYYFLLASLPAAEGAKASAASWPFFGLSVAIAVIAASMRWWWRDLRLHVYAIAIGMSLFVLLSAVQAEGAVTLLLVLYSALALALALWEQEPLALALPAAYGFAALLAAWRYYRPDDAYLPLTFSAIAAALFASRALLPLAAQRMRRGALDGRWAQWAEALSAIAFVYAVAAPIVAGGRLAILSDPRGMIGTAHFYDTPLFRMTAVSVGLIALAAVTTRWWLASLRPVIYGVALAMSLGIAYASEPANGQVTLLLAGYGALALALTLWELEPLALAIPAAYVFFAVLAAWRYFGANEAYLPLVISALAYALFAAYALLRDRSLPARAQLGISVSWAQMAFACSFAYAVGAPVVGWVRLAALAKPHGFVGTEHFEATLLYQTSAASVLLLAVLVLAQSWLWRRLPFAAAASALMMVALLLEIGHFRPENPQAYTAPLGVYLLAGALLALRVRGLPVALREATGPTEALGALLIMAPSFAQSLDNSGWRYGLILLPEALAFLAAALVQRRIWLLSVSLSLAVLDGVHYLFFAGGPVLPNWAILAIAGTAVMAAGTAILLGRDRWVVWQRVAQAWWRHEPLPREPT